MVNNWSGFINTNMIVSVLNCFSHFLSELAPTCQYTKMKTNITIQFRK